jgi:hypothetical protein
MLRFSMEPETELSSSHVSGKKVRGEQGLDDYTATGGKRK